MKNRIYQILLLFVLALLILARKANAQVPENFPGALTHEKYFENPKAYLSKLDSTKIGSDILIDRVLFNEKILNVNGYDKVTTIEYPDFYQIYQQLKYAHQDAEYLTEFDTLLEVSRSFYDHQKINLISILDMDFKRISKTALTSDQLIQSDSNLLDHNTYESSYLKERAVVFSCFKHNIFGDNVKFMLHKAFFNTNQINKELISVFMDFDNGNGFIRLNFGEEISVPYFSESNYRELKLKLVYKNIETNQEEVVYAHASLYRKAQTEPNNFSISGGKFPQDQTLGSVKSYIDDPHKSFTYPYEPHWVSKKIGSINVSYIKFDDYALEVNILFSPNNKSGNTKLRRPFIMVDGFDPENKRDYWETTKDKPDHELLPMERDYRGLYEYLNGGLGPWDKSADVVPFLGDKLRNDGYDLIFVNFTKGAGDVLKNAQQLRGLLNNIINGSLRDNKTEEAILVGPSMGGLITRIALTQMEKANEEHYVRTWLSFDSPHKGASLPIALQHAMVFGKDFKPSPKDLSAVNPFKSAVDKVDTPAAKQLLLHHYSMTSDKANPANEHTDIQNVLNQLGFPIFSKNYSITNGGKTTLYRSQSQIIDFKASAWTYLFGWSNYNSDGKTKIFEGSRHGSGNDIKLSINNQMALENGPGGWVAALYSLNYNTDNQNKWEGGDANIHGQKSNFIPTASAFGVPLTRENVHTTWESYTNCNDFSSGKIKTPFDGIFGMVENEEHMKISLPTTKQVIDKWFNPDFTNTIHPITRSGDPIKQFVSKASAYVAKETHVFGGNKNSFTFKKNADANIVAGKSIKFLPGFKVENGAKINARIETNTQNNYVLKKQTTKTPSNQNYLKDSPFSKQKHDYSIGQVLPTETKALNLLVYPNPAEDFLNLKFSGTITSEKIQLEILDAGGRLIYAENIESNSEFRISIRDWSKGMYLIRIKTNNSIQQTKFVKL